jgi:hypothetical protein
MLARHRTITGRFWLAAALLAASLPGVVQGEPSAHVACEATDNGARAAAKLRVLQGSKEIASGPCGKELPVPPGSYEHVVSLDGVLGAEEQRVPITVRGGETRHVRAEFETGELAIEVSRDGRRASALVILYRGDREVAKTSAGATSRLAVGRYVIEVESRGERQRREAAVTRAQRQVLQVVFGGPNAHPK